jgi:hypothetical protein
MVIGASTLILWPFYLDERFIFAARDLSEPKKVHHVGPRCKICDWLENLMNRWPFVSTNQNRDEEHLSPQLWGRVHLSSTLQITGPFDHLLRTFKFRKFLDILFPLLPELFVSRHLANREARRFSSLGYPAESGGSTDVVQTADK